jgi:hypothetical protein
MALILESGIKVTSEHLVTSPAPPSLPEVVPASQVIPILLAQKDVALKALSTFGKIIEKRNVTETAALRPLLVSQEEVHNARGHLEDWGCLWRRHTDQVSRGIAIALPGQVLGDLAMDAGTFFTNDRTLYEENEGVISAYTSLLPQHEVSAGTRPATEDQWHNFLFSLTTIS